MNSMEPQGLAKALQQQVELSQKAIAIESGDHALTFDELHTKALHLAEKILEKRLPADSPIAILAPRGINHVLAQVAVIYAGGICTPLDVKQPDSYLTTLLSRLDCALVITDPEYQGRLLGYDHLLADHEIHPEHNKEASGRIAVPSKGPTACSHIFHTSGTTGQPKAVQVLAKGILNLTYHATYRVERGQRFSHIANVSFDAALFEIWVSLLSGATIVVIPQDVVLDPEAFSNCLRSEKVNVTFLTTALLTSTANAVPNAFATLQILYTGGEAMNVQTVKTIFENGPPQLLLNLYGPTECTVYVFSHPVIPSDLEANNVPLGLPIGNMTATVLDEELNPVKNGEVGELLIQGAGVSRGYHGEPEKTAKAFVNIPHTSHLHQTSSNSIFYRTGDLVRINEAGLYCFIGRKDNQVKIRGHRIELEAVEILLLETGLVNDAAVLKLEPKDSTLGAILLAYVIPKSATTNSHTIIREFVQRTPHMVPRIEFIDEFPLRPTGKVDRKKLEQQYLDKISAVRSTLCKANDSPRKYSYSAIVEHLENLWLEILCLPVTELTSSCDFFHLGGTSLQAATLVGRVRQAFGVELQSAALYENSTLESLGRLVQTLQAGDQLDPRKKMEALWEQDCDLGKGLTPMKGILPDWKAPDEGRVLLTGVTGFVGAFLLYELLKMPQVRRVACLIRAKDADAGWTRFQKNLEKYEIHLSSEMKKRVLIVPGDLGQPRLGLSQDIYDLLAGWSSVIFHLGAQVSYVQPYSTHRSANVLGTLRMLEFANHQRPKMLHYSSSIASYGPSGFVLGAKCIGEDERPREYMRALNYDTGYSQSQMVAECVVWNAIDNGLPAAIFRPGFVLGHSKSGISNPDDFVGRLFSSCLTMGSYPILPAQRKEFIPVDFVVGALLHIAASPARLGRAYNLIQPCQQAALDMISTFELLNSLSPVALRPLPYSEWVKSFSLKTDDPLHPLMPMLQEKVLGDMTRWEVQENMATFGTKNLREALQDAPMILQTEPMSNLFKQYAQKWMPTNLRQ
ncbi:non-ribosomal peptide synthetase [Penicillium pulvis]|uniref:non-ribosomal peptide synthetase n=1 Tax=Penicillium pulvis TaxID=1562058 RepID=UPI002546E0C6|nr:non-ribosomal peptide synthetase [Penicillium pulvis]KAJ5801837.1 non-ribosomal peptide synthetase [Penicillium pulvis]